MSGTGPVTVITEDVKQASTLIFNQAEDITLKATSILQQAEALRQNGFDSKAGEALLVSITHVRNKVSLLTDEVHVLSNNMGIAATEYEDGEMSASASLTLINL